ncbi:MAG: TetR/AcrR family transcriptional regulator [Acidimicrobiia bacterium]|nr:TetR/AcrR family transcriptional regulator [Acidimicrobiia bacterium]
MSGPDTARERVLAATYACVTRSGLARTTVEDAVRESGVSRATVYRLFPGGKGQLLREAVGWEMNRFFGRLADHVAGAADLPAVLEQGLVFAHRAVREHRVLQQVLATEPGRLLPLLTVEQHRVQRLVAAYLRPVLDREAEQGRLRPGLDRRAAADYLSRMALSLMGAPGRWDLEDPQQVRRVVREELLGGILAPGVR